MGNSSKRVAALFGVILTSLSAASHAAGSPENITNAEDFLSYQKQLVRGGATNAMIDMASTERDKAMMEYAKMTAIRAAMSMRFKQIQWAVQTNSRNLDAIYNFQPLMIQQRVVPPVITEARNLYNQDNHMQIRLSRAIYNIVKQARFSTTAPNWRDYLNFSYESNAFPDYAFVSKEIYPKTSHERKLWEDATKEGWRLGLAQANGILQQAMDRLNRDYIGMIRFHEFVLDGKINSPVINSYNLYDNNDGDRLRIDEQLLQIEVLPSFITQPFKPRYNNSKYVGLGAVTLKNDGNSGVVSQTPIEETFSPALMKYMQNVRNNDLKANGAQPWLNNTGIVTTPNPLETKYTIEQRPVSISNTAATTTNATNATNAVVSTTTTTVVPGNAAVAVVPGNTGVTVSTYTNSSKPAVHVMTPAEIDEYNRTHGQ